MHGPIPDDRALTSSCDRASVRCLHWQSRIQESVPLQQLSRAVFRVLLLGLAATLAAATGPTGPGRLWLRHTVDGDGVASRRTTHIAVHAAHADRDHRFTVSASDGFGKRALRAVPGGIGLDRDLFLVVDHLLDTFE